MSGARANCAPLAKEEDDNEIAAVFKQQQPSDGSKPGAVARTMRVRSAQVDEHELRRLLRDDAMRLPDLGVCMSGMAGRFPKCDSINEFEEHLRQGSDMVNDQDEARFQCGLWGLPPRAGRLNDLSQFDHDFFGFTNEQANYIDFQLRILYEVVYESLLDAGLNPAELRGTNTGVFFGLHCNEFENAMADDPAFKTNGYYAQYAVKVAQYFDFRGITLTFDAACASGFVGLHNAVEALRDGVIEQAIVCSSNIPVHPTGSFIFFQMQMLSPTGYSRFLDARADGYVKSEACVSLVLQRKHLARRNYASFMATMTSVDGHKPEGITFPSDKSQEALIRASKEVAHLSTNHVEYLEAHGTGTPAGDPQEARAISSVYYAEDSDDAKLDESRLVGPLLVGSVKTNMGHSEAASGLCALAKVALMLENEIIYKNLHFDRPNANIEPLMDGRLKFVDETMPLTGKIIPLSCYGFGGSNVHAICRANEREQISQKPQKSTQLARLVLAFGRKEELVNELFDKLLAHNTHNTRNCLSEDFLNLLDTLSSGKIDRLMTWRGFTLVRQQPNLASDHDDTTSDACELKRSVKQCILEPLELEHLSAGGHIDMGRRVHFQEVRARACNLLMPGLGSEWPAMCVGLRKLPNFWSTIERLNELLEPFMSDVQLVDLLLDARHEQTLRESLASSFVCVTAVQVALVNLVKHELRVNHLGAFVGHSLGEIACAYAAGLFDERDAIMVAYHAGKTLDDNSQLISGKMVTLIGDTQTAANIIQLVNEHTQHGNSVRVSCINGHNSITVSGRHDELDAFLSSESVRKLNLLEFTINSRVALHNTHLMGATIRRKLCTALERVLLPLSPYDRTQTRWVCSFKTVHEKSANVDYFADMFCSQIDFSTALEQLEHDSIVYELGPSCLFESQVLLACNNKKFWYVKSLVKSNINEPAEKQVERLLCSFGELYQAGTTFDLAHFYERATGERVELPVRRQTPSLSSLFNWDHSSTLFVPRYPQQFSKSSAKSELPVDLVQDRDKYLAGHCIEGRVLYPATGYLLLVWRIFSFTQRKIYDACFQDIERELLPAEFTNVRLLRAVILNNRQAQLYVHYEESSGKFEVKEGGSVVVEGYVHLPRENPTGLLYESVRERMKAEQEQQRANDEQTSVTLNRDDVYKQFRISGYDYGDTFQCIEESSLDGRFVRVKFNGHFVSLTDSVLQTVFLAISQYAPTTGALFLPTRFDYVRFQPETIVKKLHDAKMTFDKSDGSLDTKAKREMMNKIMQRSADNVNDEESGSSQEEKGPVVSEQGEGEQAKVSGDDEQAESKSKPPECFFDTYCDPITGVVITDGIEMRGVKASPAPRRSDHNNEVLLESYQFVCDDEQPLDDERLTRFNELVRPYASVCDRMALKLLARLFNANNNNNPEVDDAIESYKKQHLTCLYEHENPEAAATTTGQQSTTTTYDIKKNGPRTLMSVYDQLLVMAANCERLSVEHLRNQLELNRVHLMRDLLQASFMNERLMRPLVETIIENACAKKSSLRMIEINTNDGIMRPQLYQMIHQLEPQLSIDYALAHPNPDRLHGTQTGASTQTSDGAPPVAGKTHTLRTLDSLIQDNHLKGLDLIVYKDTSCYELPASGQELISAVASLKTAIRPGGYCMLIARQELTLAERVLFALNSNELLSSSIQQDSESLGAFVAKLDECNAALRSRCEALLHDLSTLSTADSSMGGGGQECDSGAALTSTGGPLIVVAKKSDLNGCLVLLLRRTELKTQQPSDAQPVGGEPVLSDQSLSSSSMISDMNSQFGSICEANGDDGGSRNNTNTKPLLIQVQHEDLSWLYELKRAFNMTSSKQDDAVTSDTNSDYNSVVSTAITSDITDETGDSDTREQQVVWLCAIATRARPINGLIGMMQALRKELGSQHLRCFYDAFTFKNYTNESISVEQIRASAHFKVALQRDQLWTCIDEYGRTGSYRHLTIGDYLSYDTYLCSAQHKQCVNNVLTNNSNTGNALVQGAYVNNVTRGDLSSFAWFETPFKHMSSEECAKQLVRVAYSALNFRDVMLATGRLPLDALPARLALADCLLGLEFAGRELGGTGRRVMGMVYGRGLATHVSCPRDSTICLEVPQWMSLKEAATIPVAYATVIMALVYRGRIQRGESILVHAGSGGVGQAAIRVALHYGLDVYTTVGSDEKRAFLLDEFGQQTTSTNFLRQDHIFNSRSCEFEHEILTKTRGRGVDLVLNSLADDKLQASLNCLADGGRFLEIGKYDMSVDARLELLKLDTNKTFHGILLDKLFDTDQVSDSFKSQLECVLSTLRDGLAKGYIKPIKYKVFKRTEIEEAFRFMATGKHVGKILVQIDETLDLNDEQSCHGVTNEIIQPPRCVPLFQLTPEKSYIVTGGLGGFGLELCKWLVARGARHLVITSRQGARTGYQKAVLKRLQTQSNAQVRVVLECEADATNERGAQHLCELARDCAPSQQVGAIFHLAMVLRDTMLENMSADDFKLVCRPKVDACVQLDRVTRLMQPSLDYFVVFSSVTSGKGNAGQANYAYANSCLERVCELRRRDNLHGLAIQWGAIGDVGVAFDKLGGNDVVVGGTLPQRMPSCFATLAKLLCAPFATCLSVLPVSRQTDGLGEKGDLVGAIMHVLGIKDASKVSDDATLGELGLDSLMAVEIRQYIEREHEMTLNIQEIRALTIARIREISDGTATTAAGNKSAAGKKTPEAGCVAANTTAAKQVVVSGGDNKTSSVIVNQNNTSKGEPQTTSIVEQSSDNLRSTPTSGGVELDATMVAPFVPALELPQAPYCRLNKVPLNSSQTPLFFLPPIHGQFDRLKSVCGTIKRPCIGLEWTRELGCARTIDEAVRAYMRVLNSHDWSSGRQLQGVESSLKLDLCGYSFGATIAFELMLAIEKHEFNGRLRAGRLVLLDGSPHQTELGSHYLSELTTGPRSVHANSKRDQVDELLMMYILASSRPAYRTNHQSRTKRRSLAFKKQVDLIDKRLTINSNIDYAQIKRQLSAIEQLNDKVKWASAKLIELLANNELCSLVPSASLRQFKRMNKRLDNNAQLVQSAVEHAIEAFLRRYELIDNYQVNNNARLQTSCTLIRAEQMYLKSATTPSQEYDKDLGLSPIVERLDVHVLRGNHETFLSKNRRKIGQIMETMMPSNEVHMANNELEVPVETTTILSDSAHDQLSLPHAELGA